MSKRGQPYFDFSLEVETGVRRAVSFSPEKHALLERLGQKKQGCEMKNIKIGSNNDILVTDYTSVYESTPKFEMRGEKVKISTVEEINTKVLIYERVSVCGIIFNLGEDEMITHGHPCHLKEEQ